MGRLQTVRDLNLDLAGEESLGGRGMDKVADGGTESASTRIMNRVLCDTVA